MSRRFKFLVSILMNAAWASLVQALAILVLPPSDYGRFAVAYIFFAIATVLVLAIISDSWARATTRCGNPASWDDYSSALLMLTILIFAVLVPLLLVIGLSILALPLAVAITFSVYRIGARYYWATKGTFRLTALPETCGVLVMSGIFFGLTQVTTSQNSLVWSWAAGGVVVATLSVPPALKFRTAITKWLFLHRSDMRLLVLDSLAVEGAGLGIPLVLAGIMGPTQFGIYRGISSTAIPVRLILNPLRPVLASKPRAFFSQFKTRIAAALLGLGIALVVYASLEYVRNSNLASGSTLSELSNHSALAAVFVWANFVSSLYYIANRTHLAGRAIFNLRVIQIVVSVAGPLLGYLADSLNGAISGFVISAVINTFVSVTATAEVFGRKND